MTELDFFKQYNKTYEIRLETLKKLIMKNSTIADYNLPILELNNDNIVAECIIIAIFYVQTNIVCPLIMKEEENKTIIPDTYINQETKYFLEDSASRIELKFVEGFRKLYSLTSGMVLGFVGRKDENNIFKCSNVIFPAEDSNNPKNLNGKILLFSNSKFDENTLAGIKVITDYCSGKVESVFLLGDIIDSGNLEQSLNLLQFYLKNSSIETFLIPGEGDPTSKMIPQFPIHEAFYNKDKKILDASKVRSLTNPAFLTIFKANFILIGRHIISDILKYVPDQKFFQDGKAEILQCEAVLKVLEQLYKIKHIVPNAPATLSCFPYSNNDPFVIESCDFLIAGGCNKPSIKKIQGKLLVTVPDFKATNTAMLLDLETSEFETLKFE